MESPPTLESSPRGGGPPVLVRNTFLHVDVDRPPTPPSMHRASTAPSPKTTGLARRDAAEEGESSSDSSSEDGEPVRQCLSDGDAPPQPDGIEVTQELYESSEQWEWAKDDAAFVRATTYAPESLGTKYPQYSYASSSAPGMPARLDTPWALACSAAPAGTAVRKVHIAPLELERDVDVAALPMSVQLDTGGTCSASLASPAVIEPPSEPVAVLGVLGEGPSPAVGSSASTAPAEWTLPMTATAGASRKVPQPQTLTRAFSTNSGYFRVHWTVDARKLRGNDKQAISPPFELPFGDSFPCVPFKMMLFPIFTKDGKTGASFKRSQGRGIVQLKCEADLSDAHAQVRLRISIGSGSKAQPPRGPVSHTFTRGSVCGLPKDQEEWDFRAVVEQESTTFIVCLEVVPQVGDRA